MCTSGPAGVDHHPRMSLQANIEHTVDLDEFRFLLTGGISAGNVPANPLAWLGDKLWTEMNRLSHFLAFTGFAESVQQDQVSRSWCAVECRNRFVHCML